MTRSLLYGSVVVSSTFLAFGFVAAGFIPATISVGLLGSLWIFAYVRGFPRLNGLAFALFVIISVVSIWAQVSSWLALASIIFSLMAWDLTSFLPRLQMTSDNQDRRSAELAHFARLALVLGIGLMSYLATTRLRITLTFGGAALLALLGIWGISALVYRLRSHE